MRRSSRAAASSARTGFITRHGGHQEAVKSTSTGSSDSSTSAVNESSVTDGIVWIVVMPQGWWLWMPAPSRIRDGGQWRSTGTIARMDAPAGTTLGDVTQEELQLAARNHALPLEALRYPVTPV